MLAALIVNIEMVANIISITGKDIEILAGTLEDEREAGINTLGHIEISK